MCHIGSNVASKFEKYHVSRLSQSPYSPDISPCDFWFFGMLKAVLKGREFNSSNKVEQAITKVFDELTFDELQSVFCNGRNRLAWVIENGGEHINE
jgi:histone-lysine N-methyltransferase SETMAR